MLEYDVFISHASEDKEECARPLARALAARGRRVWFDEDLIVLGDSIPRAVDAGLARSRWGVVVLSHAFFRKAWPQRELDALAARETTDGSKAILPVWHALTLAEVTKYSPSLAARAAISSSVGVEGVAAAICLAMDVGEREPVVPRRRVEPNPIRCADDGTYRYHLTVKGFSDNVRNFMKYAHTHFLPASSYATATELETGWTSTGFLYTGKLSPDRMQVLAMGYGTVAEAKATE